MSGFVEKLLKRELTVDTNLHIQRAHRALARKPERKEPPRSIVVHFLEFNTKETILKKAWGEKKYDDDYATEVIQKRKAYTVIKRFLKEKGK